MNILNEGDVILRKGNISDLIKGELFSYFMVSVSDLGMMLGMDYSYGRNGAIDFYIFDIEIDNVDIQIKFFPKSGALQFGDHIYYDPDKESDLSFEDFFISVSSMLNGRNAIKAQKRATL